MSILNKDNNEFEGKIKISNFSSKEEILEKINAYCDKYKTEENDSLYDIEKENNNMILLNFHKNTELANYINRKLKLLQIENTDFSDLSFNLIIKVINPENEKYKQAKKEKEEKEKEEKENKEKNDDDKNEIPYQKRDRKKIKNYTNDIYNIDTKDNPKLNKLLGKSLNFNRRNVNKYMSPENNKMKIYESIFLGGPFIEQHDFLYKDHIKNKAQWINQKGFIPYISKETISKNNHTIKNYLSTEKYKPSTYNFREIKKTRWVGKADFAA